MTILISVISHLQGDLVFQLLQDIQRYCLSGDIEVVLTINVEEKMPFRINDFGFKIILVQNKRPQGFGANHNRAFQLSDSDYFCVINPDVRLVRDPFPILLETALERKPGLVAPLIKNSENEIEDSARQLPTPLRLLKRFINIKRKAPDLDYPIGETLVFPDWVAGICMLFPSSVFAKMKGFDERYFLYLEDADLCSRLRMAGFKIILDPRVSVIHNARRASHKNWKYFWWHMQSSIRFFSSRVYWSTWISQFNIKN